VSLRYAQPGLKNFSLIETELGGILAVLLLSLFNGLFKVCDQTRTRVVLQVNFSSHESFLFHISGSRLYESLDPFVEIM
jgi:hypothetical protein